MFDRSQDSGNQLAQAVGDAVQRSLTQEERAFGTLPNGELLARYALETFMDLVSASATSIVEDRG